MVIYIVNSGKWMLLDINGEWMLIVSSGKRLKNRLERSTMLFMGKLTFDWAIFNSCFDITRGVVSKNIKCEVEVNNRISTYIDILSAKLKPKKSRLDIVVFSSRRQIHRNHRHLTSTWTPKLNGFGTWWKKLISLWMGKMGVFWDLSG